MSFSQSTQSSRKLCWSILKYSRASTRGGQPDVIDDKLDLPIDWQAALAASSQHGLELELEFRDTTDLKRTLAAQLTVVWVDTGTNMVYESVDLNSFSPLISKMSTMPIKVAYQKSVVGIRYAVRGCWRRFQIKFLTPDDAQSFIESIQDICPCKDTSSTRAPRSSQLPQPSQTQLSNSISPGGPQPSQRRKRAPSFSDLESLMMPPPPPPPPQPPPSTPRRPTPAAAAAAHMRFEGGSQRPSSSSSGSPSRPSTGRRSEVSRTPIRPSPLFSQAAAGDSSSAGDEEDEEEDSFLAPRPPRSKRPRRSLSQPGGGLEKTDLVEAMRTAAPSALYDGSLSDQQLESMIEDIVCEDGFVELSTKVQRMWRARVIGAARPTPLSIHTGS